MCISQIQTFPFTGEAKITGKIKSRDLPLESQDDAVLNNIEGLNDGFVLFLFRFLVPVPRNPLINRKLRGHPP